MTSNSLFRMHENELREALAVCLDRMATGSDLETCLKLYPALVDELRPLLITGLTARSPYPIPVSADAMNRSRTQALARAAVLRENRKPFLGFWGWTRRVPRFALSSVLTVVVLLTAIFTVNAATAGTLPGDPLYALKLSLESMRLNIAPGSQAQDALQEIYRERRIDEVRALLAAGREEPVTFEGVFASKEDLSGIAPERWLVSDVHVLRTIDTNVVGEMEIGMLIQVEGRTLSSGVVEATMLRPRAFAFTGLVENITSDIWTVGARTVAVNQDTDTDDGISVGTEVMVLAEFDDAGNIYARAILLTGEAEEPSSPTPTPTVTPTLDPPATDTPAETTQPTPTPSLTPTPSVSPSPSPTSSLTPEASATQNGDDDNTPEPTKTGKPEETDEPPETDEPEETDEPGDDNDNDNDNNNDNDVP